MIQVDLLHQQSEFLKSHVDSHRTHFYSYNAVKVNAGRRAELTMNYGSPRGAAAVQVNKKKNRFSFLKIVLNQKLELIDFADFSPSPTNYTLQTH